MFIVMKEHVTQCNCKFLHKMSQTNDGLAKQGRLRFVDIKKSIEHVDIFQQRM